MSLFVSGLVYGTCIFGFAYFFFVIFRVLISIGDYPDEVRKPTTSTYVAKICEKR